jgi:hypothetical protein
VLIPCIFIHTYIHIHIHAQIQADAGSDRVQKLVSDKRKLANEVQALKEDNTKSAARIKALTAQVCMHVCLFLLTLRFVCNVSVLAYCVALIRIFDNKTRTAAIIPLGF